MQKKEKDGVQWLEFDLLANVKKLKHGVFLRHGGHSTNSYGSLNLSDRRGDEPENVKRNVAKVSQVLNLKHLFWAHQCHGSRIHEITCVQTGLPPEADILSTSTPEAGLMIHHADCQAAIFYDPVHHAVANVHAGWRGNVENIYAAAIAFMQRTYGSQPKDLLVCISPSLGPEKAQFINYRTELPEHFWEFQIKPLYFDFWAISKMQLMQEGVLPHHIEIASICTYSNPQDYFSHRYDPASGRHGTVVALR